MIDPLLAQEWFIQPIQLIEYLWNIKLCKWQQDYVLNNHSHILIDHARQTGVTFILLCKELARLICEPNQTTYWVDTGYRIQSIFRIASLRLGHGNFSIPHTKYGAYIRLNNNSCLVGKSHDLSELRGCRGNIILDNFCQGTCTLARRLYETAYNISRNYNLIMVLTMYEPNYYVYNSNLIETWKEQGHSLYSIYSDFAYSKGEGIIDEDRENFRFNQSNI